MEKAQILKNIATLKTSGATWDKLAHATMLAIIEHVEKHGEVSLVNKFIKDAPTKGTRVNSVKTWFMTFGKIGYDSEKELFTFAKKKTTNLAEARKTPFWALTKEEKFTPFILDFSTIEKLVNRAVEKQADSRNNVNAAALAALQGALKLAA
jgi:hypothetical protein